MKIRRGRPKKEVSKSGRIEVRLSKKEFDELDLAAYHMDISKSELVRRALNMYYAMTKSGD